MPAQLHAHAALRCAALRHMHHTSNACTIHTHMTQRSSMGFSVNFLSAYAIAVEMQKGCTCSSIGSRLHSVLCNQSSRVISPCTILIWPHGPVVFCTAGAVAQQPAEAAMQASNDTSLVWQEENVSMVCSSLSSCCRRCMLQECSCDAHSCSALLCIYQKHFLLFVQHVSMTCVGTLSWHMLYICWQFVIAGFAGS